MLISVGIYSYKKDSTYDQFMLAGRGMTTPMLISTMVSTYYGLDILFGSSEMAFNDGLMAFFGYALSTLDDRAGVFSGLLLLGFIDFKYF